MIENKIFRFICIGILNTIVYYILYITFLNLNSNYILAVIYATFIGVLFNFKTFGIYVFNNNDKSLLLKFILVYLILFIINICFINLFNLLYNNYYISGFIAILPYSIISYYLNNKYVFKRK
jgi:putative flippase GtrA